MKPRVQTERSFGVSVGLMWTVLAAFSASRGYVSLGTVMAVIGLVLLGAALMIPTALRYPNRMWRYVVLAIASINATVILTLFFAAVITPMGLLMRLFGRNPLRPPEATSWLPYTARRRDPKHYDHMF